MRSATIVVLVAVATHVLFVNGLSAAPRLTVELASDKAEYVLGETVVLQVAVHNEGDQDLPVWVNELDDQIQIFLDSPGGAARELEIGSKVTWEVIPSTVPLRKGEWKRYALRLLYSFGPWTTQKRASTLAFPEAGEYTIHVRYPLAPKRKMFNSNTIKILLKRPQGIDAEVWRELNHEPTLLFLQHGEDATQELACAIAEILIRIPDSAYHPAMRWALGRYYYRLRNTGPIVPNPEDIENGRLFRKALGIVLQHPSDRWERATPDERLYVRRVVYALPEPTPLDKVFALATRQTGGSLIVDASINKRGSLSALKCDKSLADFMRIFTISGDSTWIRDGWGYRLVAVKEADAARGEPREPPVFVKEPPSAAPLRLELSVADSEILQHEPVVVSVRVTNVSTENVELDPRFEQEYSTLQFNLADPYGRSFPHRWIAHEDGPASWRRLGPGESIVHRQWLLFGMRRHEYFEFPGEYCIDANFITPSREGPTLTLRSEPVVFQVRRTPPSEVEVWDVFRGTAREAMGILAEPADWTRVSHRLGAIPYNWPRSRFTPWSLFFLGRGWQLRQGKYQDRARREAAAAFETLVADYPDFPMGIEARYYLAKARYELEPTSENLKVIETMIEQHPDLWLMRCAKEQIDSRRDGAAPSRPVSLP